MIIPLEVTSDRSFSESVLNTSNSIHNEINSAIGLSQTNRVESVHQLRKKLKLYRAFLKIIKHCADAGLFEPANHLLRDNGKMFSDLRDAHVRNMTLEAVMTEPAFKPCAEILQKLLHKSRENSELLERVVFVDQDLVGRLKILLEHDTAVSKFISSINGEACRIYQGLFDSYEKGFQIYYSAYLHPSAEILHEWRKRIRDLQYQFELLFPDLPALLEPWLNDIGQISDFLGQDQDINNMMTWLAKNPDMISETDSNALKSALKSKRNKLKSFINHLGKSVFRDDPEYFRQTINNLAGNG